MASVPNRFCAATAPRQQMNCGWMISSWRSRYSRQAAASTGNGRAVARRPAAKDVENVDVLAAHLHSLGDDVVEELTRPAHKRLAETVFVGPGGFAAKDQSGVRVAHAENRLGSGPGQFGATACRAATSRATAAKAAQRGSAGAGAAGRGWATASPAGSAAAGGGCPSELFSRA